MAIFLRVLELESIPISFNGADMMNTDGLKPVVEKGVMLHSLD